MAIPKNNNEIGAADDRSVSSQELATAIERHYDRWIDETEGLETVQAQIVVFVACAKKLAASHMPLSLLIKATMKAFGLDCQELEIADVDGKILVKHEPKDAQRVAKVPGPAEDFILAPGSKRRDN